MTLCCQSQKKYTINNEYTVTLKDSSHFTYRENCSWCPVGCEYGEGEYKIDDNILKLEFFPRFKSEEKIIIISESDSIQEKIISKKIRVMEDSINGIPGANVYYSIIKNYNSGTSTDINGFCNLNFDSENIPDTIAVSFIGFKKIFIPLNNKDQEIWVYPAYIGVLDELQNGVMWFKILRRNKLKRIDSL
jgi:hypothetical protein